jgi:drug/metabolite transporter (DMT)-like permease
MLPVVLPSGDVLLPDEAGHAELLAVALLGVFSTATAAVVYFRLISRAGPTFVAQLNYLIPLWAVLVGMLFLGETLQPSHLYALFLILCGILVTQLERTRPEPLQRPTSEARSWL